MTGTLAAERLDLTDFFAPFAQARTAAGLWSNEDLLLGLATEGDLDLRLSATDARVDRLRLGEMAASILVRPGRIEASLGRADLRRGTVKGRLALATSGELTELKAQGSFERLDIAALLTDLGQPRWITGQAQGQFALEGSGETVVDLVRQIHGRTTLTVRQGEIIGVGLEGAMRRIEKQPLSASLEWKGGRTAFDQAMVNLNIGAGIGEIVDGSVSAPTMRTALEGHVSLVDRSVAVRAHVSPASANSNLMPSIVFNLSGSWDDVAIAPDAKALIERSRAAKPLFGLDRSLPPSARGVPVAEPLRP